MGEIRIVQKEIFSQYCIKGRGRIRGERTFLPIGNQKEFTLNLKNLRYGTEGSVRPGKKGPPSFLCRKNMDGGGGGGGGQSSPPL